MARYSPATCLAPTIQQPAHYEYGSIRLTANWHWQLAAKEILLLKSGPLLMYYSQLRMKRNTHVKKLRVKI
jgi:hypothetical protein